MRRPRTWTAPLAAVLALAACGGGSSPVDGGNPPPQTGAVSGSVTAAGQPVPGAALQLTRADAQTRTANSGTNGSYQFTQVATGAWTLSISPPTGFGVIGAPSNAISVTANQTTTANFQLEAAPPDPGVVEVRMEDNQFNPNDVSIPVNGTVRWRNFGGTPHNSTGAGNAWVSANLAPGGTFERTFPQAGTFNYSCTLHPGMNGVVRVQ